MEGLHDNRRSALVLVGRVEAGKGQGTGSLGANCSQVTWKKELNDSRTLGDCHGKEKRKMQSTEDLLGTDWLMPSALCHQKSRWRQGV